MHEYRVSGNEKYYIFLDEIQHVENFEKALASFRATLLTGRTVEFEILPFSFYEMKQYYELNHMEWNEDMFFNYLKWGGFPLRFDYKEEASIRRYVKNLYESIINRDIIGKSRSVDNLKKMSKC